MTFFFFRFFILNNKLSRAQQKHKYNLCANFCSDQLKKALRSVPDWAQIKVCGVPVRAHGLYIKIR